MTQTPENMDAILRRCNKMLAIAEGSANENESAAAAAMVAKIMQKYRIENSDLYLAKFKDEAEFDSWESEPTARLFKWVNFVSTSIAMLYGVRATIVQKRVAPRKTVKVIRFQGFKEDVQVATWTFEYLTNTILNVSKKFHADNPKVGLSGTDSFRQAMSSRIQTRIKEHLEQQKQEESVTGRELVLAKDNAVSDKFGDNKFRTVASQITDRNAYSAGSAAGDKVDIFRRGLPASQSDAQLRLGA